MSSRLGTSFPLVNYPICTPDSCTSVSCPFARPGTCWRAPATGKCPVYRCPPDRPTSSSPTPVCRWRLKRTIPIYRRLDTHDDFATIPFASGRYLDPLQFACGSKSGNTDSMHTFRSFVRCVPVTDKKNTWCRHLKRVSYSTGRPRAQCPLLVCDYTKVYPRRQPRMPVLPLQFSKGAGKPRLKIRRITTMAANAIKYYKICTQ